MEALETVRVTPEVGQLWHARYRHAQDEAFLVVVMQVNPSPPGFHGVMCLWSRDLEVSAGMDWDTRLESDGDYVWTRIA